MKKIFLLTALLIINCNLYSAAKIENEQTTESRFLELSGEFVKPFLTIKQRKDIYDEAAKLANVLGEPSKKALENMLELLAILTLPRSHRLKIAKARESTMCKEFFVLFKNVVLFTKN